jgi:hypothetical protein
MEAEADRLRKALNAAKPRWSTDDRYAGLTTPTRNGAVAASTAGSANGEHNDE